MQLHVFAYIPDACLSHQGAELTGDHLDVDILAVSAAEQL